MPNALSNKQTEFFQAILDSSNSPILITDALSGDHPIIFVNHAFEQVTQYTAAEVIGKNCRLLQRNDRDQPSRHLLADAIRNGTSCECVIRNYRRNGEPFYNQLFMFPVKSEQGIVTNYVGIQYDVTTAHTTHAALQEMRVAIEHSIDVYLKVGPDAIVIEANKALQDVFGWTPQELIGKSVFHLVPAERVSEVQQDLAEQFADSQPRSLNGRYLRKDGGTTLVEWTFSSGAGNQSLICLGRDVTEKYQIAEEARRANERNAAVLMTITEGCFSVDRNWIITYINPQGEKWLRRSSHDLIGKHLWLEFPEAVDSAFFYTYHQAMETKAFANCDSFYEPLGRWFEARAYPYPEGLTVFFMDITQRKTAEAILIHSASHDQMTGLMNRTACLDTIDRRLEETRHRSTPLAILFIDLDRFKEVNDAFGHRVGDQVLTEISRRLIAQSDANKIPARISGDEFIFIVSNSEPDKAKAFSHQLIDAIAAPIDVEGIDIALGASVGVAFTADGNIAADELVNQADTAMYWAKESGRHAVCLFSPDIDHWGAQRLKLRHEIRPAIEQRQFVLHYQPQFRVADNAVAGAEALVRWQHPKLGLLNPIAFLEIAEASPVINELGAWICDEACRQLASWNRLGHTLIMSINVSARQLGNPALHEMFAACARKHGVDPKFIKIEITESMLSQDVSIAEAGLNKLKEYGFRIALDDFGTGYSNFTYLHRFPVTALKIDRSFVQPIAQDAKALAMLNGIISLAKAINLTVICEGVETENQREALLGTGCDLIQGYLTGRPLVAEEFTQLHLTNVRK
ncbi:EAL domain-containing protein [Noviherbaspirillum sp. CPCC 100848]|uniref:EAL domain-containing protein n=2 Tax=Noviherbaspirillum album TaxID=3080276 RepID=A0ABU6JJE4_9BURK|nr:EAL domain-containing protein [Noviherbaspirillum sp. CPCC 100848]